MASTVGTVAAVQVVEGMAHLLGPSVEPVFSVGVVAPAVFLRLLQRQTTLDRLARTSVSVEPDDLVRHLHVSSLETLCVPNSDVNLEFWLTLSPRWCSLDLGPHLAPTLDA
jgi:hypothetical protein